MCMIKNIGLLIDTQLVGSYSLNNHTWNRLYKNILRLLIIKTGIMDLDRLNNEQYISNGDWGRL